MKRVILGIDEVGRGPYAGPLVIGACILPEDRENHPWINELNDSKKLSKKKREELYLRISKNATFATGWVTAEELDKIGISKALNLATARAVKKIQAQKVPFTEIVIDGISNFLKNTPLEKYVTTMKKADFYVKEVSAASIVAKFERDKYMVELAQKYPGYDFENNVGYGTAKHQAAMERLGLTPEHRRSFAPVAKLKNTTKIGNKAEGVVADFLEKSGHKILERNYKTKLFEIDIISEKDEVVYFTEVKHRKNLDHGSPKMFVDKKKTEKMKLGAECLMKNKNKSFRLAVGCTLGEDFEFLDWFTLDF